MNITNTFEIDKYDSNYATLTVRDDSDNYVNLMFINEGTDNKKVWLLSSFLSGRVNNTKYRKDRYTPTLYEKDGRGRESEYAREYMRKLYSRAVKEIFNY